LADVGTPIQEAMAGYNEKLPDLFSVHVVAELETADKFLKALRGLQELHQTLVSELGSVGGQGPHSGYYSLDHVIGWIRRCTHELEKAIPPMVAAVAAMRSELGVPTDEEQYAELIRGALKTALDRNERLFRELIARRRGEGGDPAPDDAPAG
jgi:hypothetical protein